MRKFWVATQKKLIKFTRRDSKISQHLMQVFSIQSKLSFFRCAIWLSLTKLKDLKMKPGKWGRIWTKEGRCLEALWLLTHKNLISFKLTILRITTLCICIITSNRALKKFSMPWISKNNSLNNSFTASCTLQGKITMKIRCHFLSIHRLHLHFSRIKMYLRVKPTSIWMVVSNKLNSTKIEISKARVEQK